MSATRNMALTLRGNANFPAPRATRVIDRPMTMDVIDLRDFYSQRLGIVARQLINQASGALAGREGQRVLGIGYPTPISACSASIASAASRSCRRRRAC